METGLYSKIFKDREGRRAQPIDEIASFSAFDRGWDVPSLMSIMADDPLTPTRCALGHIAVIEERHGLNEAFEPRRLYLVPERPVHRRHWAWRMHAVPLSEGASEGLATLPIRGTVQQKDYRDIPWSEVPAALENIETDKLTADQNAAIKFARFASSVALPAPDSEKTRRAFDKEVGEPRGGFAQRADLLMVGRI